MDLSTLFITIWMYLGLYASIQILNVYEDHFVRAWNRAIPQQAQGILLKKLSFIGFCLLMGGVAFFFYIELKNKKERTSH